MENGIELSCGEATFEDFLKLDIRVGKILEAAPLEGARKPAYRLRIDFGQEIGEKNSSAQICDAYQPADLIGRLVMAVVNFPPRRIAGFKSEVLTLGVYSGGGEGPVILIAPDEKGTVKVGDRLG